MPASEDQRALLRLLLDGAGYEQIAEVLGTEPSEVRERARRAVADLEDEGDDAELVRAARARLDELESGSSPASPMARQRRTPSGMSGLVPWMLLGGVLLAAVVVLVVISGSGDSNSSTTASTGSAQEDVVTVELRPVAGSHARGTARIVRVADRPAVDLEVRDLTPSAQGQTYVLSLVDQPTGKSLPVAFREVGPDGRFSGRTEIADAAAGLLPNFDTMEISLADDRQAAASVQAAARSATLPDRIGSPVLRGNLP